MSHFDVVEFDLGHIEMFVEVAINFVNLAIHYPDLVCIDSHIRSMSAQLSSVEGGFLNVQNPDRASFILIM